MERSQDSPGRLEGRRALVLGGTGGIGAEVAVTLAGKGAELVVHGGSSPDRLERTLSRIRAVRGDGRGRGEARGFVLDIQRPLDLIRKLEAERPFDIVVAAFGPFLQAPLHATSPGDWERLALLDLALPGALASACLPGMMEAGYGRFLFFGGTRTDAIRAYSTNAAYAAAKTGLGVLVKSIASEYAAHGVAAYLLCPGFVRTEYLGEEQRAALASRSPCGSLLDPAAIADFGVSLIADDTLLASGSIINMDGGLKL